MNYRALNGEVTETVLIHKRFALATILKEDCWQKGRVEQGDQAESYLSNPKYDGCGLDHDKGSEEGEAW